MDEHRFLVVSPGERYFLDDHCGNCLVELSVHIDGLYCSTWCQEIAGSVRYKRRVMRDGRFNDPEVQAAVFTTNSFLLIGGYKSLGRTLSPPIRREVKARDSGHCQQCGEPGTEIDHINGSSDGLQNLQLLCTHCHREKTARALGGDSPSQSPLLLGNWITRVMPEVPILLADDQAQWPEIYRRLKSERRRRLRHPAGEDLGVDRPDHDGIEGFFPFAD